MANNIDTNKLTGKFFLTAELVAELRRLCESFNPVELLGEGYPFINKAEIPELGYKWNSRSEFNQDIFNLTGKNTIKEAHRILYEWESALSSGAPVDETVPKKDRLDQLEKEAEERQKAAQEAKGRAETQTREQIERLEEKAARERVRASDQKPTTDVNSVPSEAGSTPLTREQTSQPPAINPTISSMPSTQPGEIGVSPITDKAVKETQKMVASNERPAASPAQSTTPTPIGTEVSLSPSEQRRIVYLEPKESPGPVKLSAQEQVAKERLEVSARQNPRLFVQTISSKIENNLSKIPDPAIKEYVTTLPKPELKAAINNVAADFTTRLLMGNQLSTVPSGVYASMLNSDDIPGVLKSEALPALAIVTASSEDTVRQLLTPTLGANLTEFFYQKPDITYIVSTEPSERTTHQVSLGGIADSWNAFRQNPIAGFVEGKAKEKILGIAQQRFNTFIGKLPAQGGLSFVSRFASSSGISSALSYIAAPATQYQVTSSLGWVIRSAAPEMVPVFTNLAGRIGINIGFGAINTLAPVAATTLEVGAVTAVTTTATGTGAAVATSAAATAAGTAIGEAAGVAAGTAAATATGTAAGVSAGAAAGSVAPIVGTAIGAIVGFVAGKLLPKVLSWLKRNKSTAVILASLPLATGVFIGSIPLILFGTVFAIGFTAATVGGASLLTGGVGGFFGGIFNGFFGLVLKSIAIPFIVSILGLAVSIALIMFIINSGAYIVPPHTSTAIEIDQSPYINVSKVASVTNLSNSQLTPATVNYTVTISAPLGTISNISFKNECVVTKSGSIPPCTPPLPNTVPETIGPAEPYVFTYSQEFDSSFANSLVADTFSVTADAPDAATQTSISTASIVIGSPPTSCFEVVGSNWPANHKANIMSAIATLSSSFPTYTAKVCAAGTVRLVYDTTKNPGGWGYYSGRTIYFNGGGLNSAINALYIFSHETGHHVQSVSFASLMVYYLNNFVGLAQERPLCSYVNTGNPYEAFAEAIALFVTRDQSSQWKNKCSGTFQTTYPRHYNFAETVIFK